MFLSCTLMSKKIVEDCDWGHLYHYTVQKLEIFFFLISIATFTLDTMKHLISLSSLNSSWLSVKFYFDLEKYSLPFIIIIFFLI